MFSGWFGGAKKPEPALAQEAPAKPKPCCVCKEEKAKRDECMLNNEDGEKACGDLIAQYKKCMKGYGFEI